MQAFIGWVVLAFVLVSVIPFGGNVPLVSLALGLVVTLLFGVQLTTDFNRSRALPTERSLAPVAILFLGVLVWAGFQLFATAPVAWAHPAYDFVGSDARIAVNTGAGRWDFLRLATYAMLFVIVARVAVSERFSRRAITAVALFTGLIAAITLFGIASGQSPFADNAGSASGPFVNRNHFATYLGIGLLANLAALGMAADSPFAGEGRRSLRVLLETFFDSGWIYLVGALMTLGALLLTASRGGFMAAVVAGALFGAIAWRGAAGRARVLVGVAVLGLAGFAFLTVGDLVVERADLDAFGDLRLAVFPSLVQAIGERPFIGVGLGGFEDAFYAFAPPDTAEARFDAAHNEYLQNAFELGVPAAVALYLSLALIGWRLAAGFRQRRRLTVVPTLAFCALILVALHSMVEFSVQMPAVAALFTVVLAIGWSQSFSQNDRTV